ncbi:hypothetical protein EX30DRAFT_84153 [Ascodesmis nigricans]|uniref:Amidohydrolase 3 domain-containing protein n=1 Tax=Ascodesmis nigricans TaxID=341454 RepID=A0A4S2N301_9PEZI|nr:hypothetical protein EX30DRAFT_84153 [Ascodesmis nigricans]
MAPPIALRPPSAPRSPPSASPNRSIFDFRFFSGIALGCVITTFLHNNAGITSFLADTRVSGNLMSGNLQQWRQQIMGLVTKNGGTGDDVRKRTYCYYGGVITLDDEDTRHKCFTLSPDRGTFERVFTPDDGPNIGNLRVELTDASEGKYIWYPGTAVPGFWDGHGHVLQYGEMLESVQLFGAGSVEEVRRRVKEYIKQHPGAGTRENWVRGIGWDQAYFDGKMPTADDLARDPKLEGLYILLDRVDVHCTWASPAVLSLLPSPLPEIPGGFTPSPGIFCDNSMTLPFSFYPPPNSTTLSSYLTTAQSHLHSYGIVGVHDASVPASTLRLYDALADANKLSLRVYAMHECSTRNSFCLNDPHEVPPHRRNLSLEHQIHHLQSTGHPILRAVKLFSDGALGSRGAALLEPYTDDPTTSGTLLVTPEHLTNVTTSWIQAGWQVNIHAIGDRANRVALDALITGLRSLCTNSSSSSSDDDDDDDDITTCIQSHQHHLRTRIEHTQIITPSDQSRLLTHHILPSLQPTHAISDSRYALSRLGPDRLTSSAYRIKSFLRPENNTSNGIVMGSDFPVESPDVVAGMRAAVGRRVY